MGGSAASKSRIADGEVIRKRKKPTAIRPAPFSKTRQQNRLSDALPEGEHQQPVG